VRVGLSSKVRRDFLDCCSVTSPNRLSPGTFFFPQYVADGTSCTSIPTSDARLVGAFSSEPVRREHSSLRRIDSADFIRQRVSTSTWSSDVGTGSSTSIECVQDSKDASLEHLLSKRVNRHVHLAAHAEVKYLVTGATGTRDGMTVLRAIPRRLTDIRRSITEEKSLS
jgi:hypothetical protein